MVPKAINLRRQMGYVCAPAMSISAVYKQQGVVKEGFPLRGITRCGMLNELHHQGRVRAGKHAGVNTQTELLKGDTT